MTDHKYLTTEEAAEELRVSTATLRTWIKLGKLPSACYFKLGGTYRFRAEALQALLRGDLDTNEEKEEGAPEQLELDFERKQQEPVRPQTETGAPSVDEDY